MDSRLVLAWTLTAVIGLGAHFFASGSTADFTLHEKVESTNALTIDNPGNAQHPEIQIQKDQGDELDQPLQESAAHPQGEPNRAPAILAPPIIEPDPPAKATYLDYSSDQLQMQAPESEDPSSATD